MRFFLVLIFCVSLGLSKGHAQDLRVAFGSCSRQDLSDKQLWKEVLEVKPDAWVWTGDNVYADTRDMEKMRAMYEKQKSHPDYQLLRSKAKIYGTWDDHDYGENDGGKNFTMKAQSKIELMRFLDLTNDEALDAHEGVYQSYDLKNKSGVVRLILLDTRSFRDDLVPSKTKGRRYDINPEGDVLGEAQWQWFEKELSRPGADVFMVITSIQLIPVEHGFEKWANLPKARQKFLDVLSKAPSQNIFLVSGDRHIAEVSALTIPGWKNPLYEFTSSGLTHTWTIAGEEPNGFRKGPLIAERNFGWIGFNWVGKEVKLDYHVVGPEGKILYELNLSYPLH
ncbi:MAG: alkaline phosphatase family protein [Bacteroidetes bacterium]|nr:alkaline phosphatase family protein [Bacteroidota bacterium]